MPNRTCQAADFLGGPGSCHVTPEFPRFLIGLEGYEERTYQQKDQLVFWMNPDSKCGALSASYVAVYDFRNRLAHNGRVNDG